MSALDTQVGGNHYRNGSIQPVQYIEANQLGYLEGVVLKRITRHNQPGGKGIQDIQKAIHELQLLLELRYPTTLGQKAAPTHRTKACLICLEPEGHGGLPCPKFAISSGSCASSQMGSEPGYLDTERLLPLDDTSQAQD